MSEPEEHEPDAVTKVARDLSAIVELATHIEARALDRSRDRLMPGGKPMAELGPVANLDDWAENIAAAELRHFAICDRASHKNCTIAGAEHVADNPDDNEFDTLRNLRFWSDDWRRIHGYEISRDEQTVSREAAFIRHFLDWAWRTEPHFADLKRDINHVRRDLKNMLYDGNRDQRTRVFCPRCATEYDQTDPDARKPPRLIRVYGNQVKTDGYKCTVCKHRFDKREYADAYAKQLRSEGADKHVPLRDAIDVLRAQGRSAHTIRSWLDDGRVSTMRDAKTNRLNVWWPDLWRLHLLTPLRRRTPGVDEISAV